MTAPRRIAIVALAATVAIGALAGPAAAKLPQLRFEQRQADAGTTVSAVIHLWPSPRQLERLRFFLVHAHDLAAMFRPYEWMIFGKSARAATRDSRLIELAPVAVADSVTADGWITVEIALPDGIRRGRYTTAVLVCSPGCVLELGLTPRRLTILRSIGKWDQRLALRVG